jgi:hypothetical protein
MNEEDARDAMYVFVINSEGRRIPHTAAINEIVSVAVQSLHIGRH